MLTFFLVSFSLGVAAAAALGPMFVLTFNRSAARGAWAGIFTGMGAATIDGAYFFLGLSGTLNLIEGHPAYLGVLQLLGGTALFIFGMTFLVKEYKPISVRDNQTKYHLMFAQGVGMTIFNPMVIFFFMAASLKVLTSYASTITLFHKVVGSLFLASGSLTVFIAISLAGHFVGHRVSHAVLRVMQYISGVCIVGIGCYVLWSARSFVFA